MLCIAVPDHYLTPEGRELSARIAFFRDWNLKNPDTVELPGGYKVSAEDFARFQQAQTIAVPQQKL